MEFVLEFEKPIIELENQIKRLQEAQVNGLHLEKLKSELCLLRKKIYENLTPWQKVQIARHPNRPLFKDYLKEIFEDFTELRGDRYVGDDRALIGGISKFCGQTVFVIGHNKGKDLQENMECNFGMAQPYGYKKALRIAKLAERFQKPLICFVDTPGAYPGKEAEELGQHIAIAENLQEFIFLKTQILVIIIGEGGSGGALAIAVVDRILMLEHAIFSVISPEGCASILWRDGKYKEKAAEALKLTADDLLELKLIDQIIPEPIGGAHSDPQTVFKNTKKFIFENLQELKKIPIDELINKRYEKFRNIGFYKE